MVSKVHGTFFEKGYLAWLQQCDPLEIFWTKLAFGH
jgi:hypothetical protein